MCGIDSIRRQPGRSRQLKRRARLARLATPAASLLVTGLLVMVSSYAAFSATGPTNSTAKSTSLLKLENNGGGTYQLTTRLDLGGQNIRPGDTRVRCLTVKSNDAMRGDLRLYARSVTDTHHLAKMIDITVEAASTPADVTNCAAFPTVGIKTLYRRAALASLPTNYSDAAASAISIASGVTRLAYRISWTLDRSADNSLMNSTASAEFTWELQEG